MQRRKTFKNKRRYPYLLYTTYRITLAQDHQEFCEASCWLPKAKAEPFGIFVWRQLGLMGVVRRQILRELYSTGPHSSLQTFRASASHVTSHMSSCFWNRTQSLCIFTAKCFSFKWNLFLPCNKKIRKVASIFL